MARPLNEYVNMRNPHRKTGFIESRQVGIQPDAYANEVEKLGPPSPSIWRAHEYWWPVIQRAERFEEEP